MSHAVYVASGYAVVVAAVGLYTWWVLARARLVARRRRQEATWT